ncbi:hypothetical protein [uncultured Comamonas sp.]|uniref:hypothetical protein n=1 Tax=uncultured Comamonas sp. TaxID=114710 RepID=UPI00374922C2
MTNCLPDLRCIAEGTITKEPTDRRTQELEFEQTPAGWWHVVRARNAYMQPGLPMDECELTTRLGLLRVNDKQQLLFNGRPAMAGNHRQQTIARPESPPAMSDASSTRARLQAWGSDFSSRWRNQLLAVLGQSGPDDAPVTAPMQAMPATQAHSTAEAIQENTPLSIVAHLEIKDREMELLQNT